ncbi:MAG: alpha/beta hydrolase [Sphingomonas sp.]|nr:alpha/beta hydrolase [Sphingomonas sp.]
MGRVEVSSSKRALLGLTIACALAAPARSQDATMVPIRTPAQTDAIVLGTGPLPGAAPESWYHQYGKDFARNVTVATLTPFLPDPAKATGTAVIVAPGGGFRSLSMENEGSDVARALAAKGVAAFVLKYRLNQTPPTMAGFEQSMAAMFAGTGRPPSDSWDLAPQLADSRAAFALLRKRAAEWHVDPARIGMVGFSAGAMLTLQTALQPPQTKPAFIGIIYGPLQPVTVPADAPPMFVALAADDPLFGGRGMGLIESWTAAKRPVEFHLYEQGGHGFGMYPKETTSTGWFEAFVRWLDMHHMLAPARR